MYNYNYSERIGCTRPNLRAILLPKWGLFSIPFWNGLPFPLTEAQNVWWRNSNDLGSSTNERLLQGDGFGKTVVAFMSMLGQRFSSLFNGSRLKFCQSQHYNSLLNWCKLLNISISILTGSTSTSNRKSIHENLQNGSLQLLVGTHASGRSCSIQNLGLPLWTNNIVLEWPNEVNYGTKVNALPTSLSWPPPIPGLWLWVFTEIWM